MMVIPKPQELLLAVMLANIYAEIDKRGIYFIIHSIWLAYIAGTFDCDRTLVVSVAGRTS